MSLVDNQPELWSSHPASAANLDLVRAGLLDDWRWLLDVGVQLNRH
ncbi:hypothetical protein [Candidatus Accumulibacter sp. ACC003]|nr:hypothetical protein [Candidatus Accumulibacter sp. ACC003]